MQVSLEALTAEAFEPYGQVLSAPKNGSREDFVASVENMRSSARPNFALIAADPGRFPLTLEYLERHAYSNQAFLPLDVSEYLIVVCRDDGKGRPDLSTLRAFRVGGHSGINYKAGTWHYGMTTIGAAGTFAMLVHEDGSADDCHFIDVAPIVIVN